MFFFIFIILISLLAPFGVFCGIIGSYVGRTGMIFFSSYNLGFILLNFFLPVKYYLCSWFLCVVVFFLYYALKTYIQAQSRLLKMYVYCFLLILLHSDGPHIEVPELAILPYWRRFKRFVRQVGHYLYHNVLMAFFRGIKRIFVFLVRGPIGRLLRIQIRDLFPALPQDCTKLVGWLYNFIVVFSCSILAILWLLCLNRVGGTYTAQESLTEASNFIVHYFSLLRMTVFWEWGYPVLISFFILVCIWALPFISNYLRSITIGRFLKHLTLFWAGASMYRLLWHVITLKHYENANKIVTDQQTILDKWARKFCKTRLYGYIDVQIRWKRKGLDKYDYLWIDKGKEVLRQREQARRDWMSAEHEDGGYFLGFIPWGNKAYDWEAKKRRLKAKHDETLASIERAYDYIPYPLRPYYRSIIEAYDKTLWEYDEISLDWGDEEFMYQHLHDDEEDTPQYVVERRRRQVGLRL